MLKRIMSLSASAKVIVGASCVVAGLSALPAMAEPFVIGVSNGYVDAWRSQMIDAMIGKNAELMAEGVTGDLVIQSGNTNVQGQISQIRALVTAGVDAILVVPSSSTALNPVLEEAQAAGILVLAVTQDVTAPTVTGVMVDQATWATQHAKWLAEMLEGQGGVVLMNGLAGAPANEERVAAVTDVFGQFDGITILNSANGDWDVVKAQQAMSSVLAAQPDIDGVWVSGAMSEGVLRALVSANPSKWPVVTGDTNLGYLRLWQTTRESKPDFETIGVMDPPALPGVAALEIAVKMLQGAKLKPELLSGPNKRSLFLPLPEGGVTADQLNALLTEHADKPNTYFIDYMLNDAAIDAFFE